MLRIRELTTGPDRAWRSNWSSWPGARRTHAGGTQPTRNTARGFMGKPGDGRTGGQVSLSALFTLSLIFSAAGCARQQPPPTTNTAAKPEAKPEAEPEAKPEPPPRPVIKYRPLVVAVPAGLKATLAEPLRLRQGNGKVHRPRWTSDGLWPRVPASLYGLGTAEKPGAPTWDPPSKAWYASANGSLVRLGRDGRQAVVLDNVQARDLDLRTGPGAELLGAREPDLSITLRHLAGRGAPPVLLKGSQYFGPRISPDGRQLLVSESRAEGGHVMLLDLNSGSRQDLGPGVAPTWHPGGDRVVLARVTHNGEQLKTGDLWEISLVGGSPRRLKKTPKRVELETAISPDGRYIAFTEGRTGDLYVARYPEAR